MGLYPLDYYAARPFNPPSFGYDVRLPNEIYIQAD